MAKPPPETAWEKQARVALREGDALTALRTLERASLHAKLQPGFPYLYAQALVPPQPSALGQRPGTPVGAHFVTGRQAQDNSNTAPGSFGFRNPNHSFFPLKTDRKSTEPVALGDDGVLGVIGLPESAFAQLQCPRRGFRCNEIRPGKHGILRGYDAVPDIVHQEHDR